MNTLHSCLAYYFLAINAVAFIVYGIDKYKAKKAKWRIPEVTLLLLAVVGGSVGAWMGMKSGTIRRCTRNSNTVFLPFC